MQKAILSFILLLLLATWTGCSNHSAAERRNLQELSLNIATEPPTLDPGYLGDGFSFFMHRLFFEGLTRPCLHATYELAVAEKVDISEDGRVYTFQLRNSVWSNGDPVTADDFVYAWKRVLDPASPSPMAHHLYLIKGARDAKLGHASLDAIGAVALDAYTLRVELNHPAPYFLEILQCPPFFPVNPRTVARNPEWASQAGDDFVTNGPFRLTEWNHFHQILVERNPTYWDAAQVQLNRIRMLMIEQGETEIALFDREEIDWAGCPVSKPLPPECIASLTAAGRMEFAPHVSTYCYLFNTTRPPFNHTKMRQALMLALNRDGIVEHVLKSKEKTATSLLPPSVSLLDASTDFSQDIGKARALFAEALDELGLDKKQLPLFVLTYTVNESYHTMAQAVQACWKQAFNIDVVLQSQERKVLVDRVLRRDFEIIGLGLTVNYCDPQAFLTRFSNEKDSNNYADWHDEQYDRLLEEANVTPDPARRTALLRHAERLLMQEVPVIPIYYACSAYLRTRRLTNVLINCMGNIDFRHAYFQRE